MLELRLESQLCPGSVLALPVVASDDGAVPPVPEGLLPEGDVPDLDAFIRDAEPNPQRRGAAGGVYSLPRPGHEPRRLLLVGVGAGDEAGWRAAGAALARAARADDSLTVYVGDHAQANAVRGLAEGLLLASYRFRVTSDHLGVPSVRVPVLPDGGRADSPPPAEDTTLGAVAIVCDQSDDRVRELARAVGVAEATCLARDLTNTPSAVKTPAWFTDHISNLADRAEAPLSVEVWDPDRLRRDGFEGILAVGGGSDNPPRMLRVSWEPPGATYHVVLVGKGVTFDTGGICIKPPDSMKLMRKDMGAAATVVATVLAAARLGLPIRLTALAALAENAVGADAYRPADVLRLRGGTTVEIIDTDAEGRLVLAEALAYAAEVLAPDVVIDLGTLTGAQNIALGKRTAALFTDNPELAAGLADAASAAGETLWRLPLVDDYLPGLDSDIADLVNVVRTGGAGCITAALFLREFTGDSRGTWAHLDMSAPAWSDSATGELAKGATGWGVRTLVRWLEAVATDRRAVSS